VAGSTVYTLQSLRAANASTAPAGWILHHRRTAPWSEIHFEPDVVVSEQRLLGYQLDPGLMPAVPWPYHEDTYKVTALTSPDGECVFSPVTGGSRTYDPKRTGPRVAVIGDSLVSQSELCWLFPPDIRACGVGLGNRLRQDGQRPWITHSPGQTFYSWLDVIRERATTRPEHMVLAFGTNDVRWIMDAPAARRELQRWSVVRAVYTAIQAVHAANPATCVVLVTVAEKDDRRTELAAETARVNALLNGMARAPNVVTADFAAAVEAECPGWQTHPAQTCRLMNADGVHLTAAGDDVRDALIVAATHACGRE
jgi:lysophospholipase L1-like esterase